MAERRPRLQGAFRVGRGRSASPAAGSRDSKADTTAVVPKHLGDLGVPISGASVAPDRKPPVDPLKVGPDVGAATAAALADEANLEIRQPHVVRPRIGG